MGIDMRILKSGEGTSLNWFLYQVTLVKIQRKEWKGQLKMYIN